VEAKCQSLWGGWYSNSVHGSYRVGVWKNIRRGWSDFSRFVRFEVVDGSRIRFWYDMWFGEMTLKEAFQVLFGIARSKKALVVDHMQFSNDTCQ
jgi:hypothetical protein